MEEMHISSSNDLGKYLGLPSMWGRSKKAALGYLKVEIQDKIHGWRSNTLSHSGKNVLIKTVITDIPTYAMSVFCLPKTWCSEINEMIAYLWWGRSETGRKIHRKIWDLLTKSKEARGGTRISRTT